MRIFTIINTVLIVLLSFTDSISAQIVISTPNLGFSQACASPSFNNYNVTFSFSPETGLSSNNQFIIELSDASGSFTNATTVYTSAQGVVTTSPATLSFSLPTTTAGEAYKLRIKSTAPVATSTGSVSFAAYYKIQDEPFTINNLVSTGAYCSGGSYVLSIDNPGGELNDSPLQYPSLTFNWFKETGPSTSVFISTGETLTVDQPGAYFVKTNYGTCTSDSYSNRVTVSEVTSTSSASISSSLGNPYCSSDGPTILSTINASDYQWFKDGVEISGATSQMYSTNEAGVYSVNINLGSCSTDASIDLQNTGFTSSIDVSEFNTMEQGETLIATVTTDAINPVYEWYLNNNIIVNETSNSYEATQFGNYKVVVTQTSGCQSSNEFSFTISEPYPNVPNIPNLISPNGDGINDTWVIPQAYVNGTNTEVIILSSKGEIVLKTDNYQNNWPQGQINFKEINPVYYYIIKTSDNNMKRGSITVVK